MACLMLLLLFGAKRLTQGFRFALQKKTPPFHGALRKAHKNPLEMKNRIDQLLNLLEAGADKKILNLDTNLKCNFGFLKDCAIEFEFGNFGNG